MRSVRAAAAAARGSGAARSAQSGGTAPVERTAFIPAADVAKLPSAAACAQKMRRTWSAAGRLFRAELHFSPHGR